jgi:hypothetical protein
MIELLTVAALYCSPGKTDFTQSMCVSWYSSCYLELANPKLVWDDNAEEYCSENIPEGLTPK